MSKIIKFRAWIFEHEEDPCMVSQGHDYYMMISNGEAFSVIADHSDYVDEDKYHIMQYTGLKDENGVEIYEGDIVNHCETVQDEYSEFKNTLVEINKDGCIYPFYEPVGSASGWLYHSEFHFDTVEVIGNIHENPELLERHT